MFHSIFNANYCKEIVPNLSKLNENSFNPKKDKNPLY